MFHTDQPDGYRIAEPAEDASTLHVIQFGLIWENGQVVAATLLSIDVTEEIVPPVDRWDQDLVS